jgi:hypothetical protein
MAPLAGWALVAAFNLGTALARGVSDTHAAALRWWVDPGDKIPELTAHWFLHRGPFLPGWQATDRGPLQPLVLLWAGGWSTHPVPAYVMGVIVNSVWVVGLWWLLRSLEVTENRIRWAALLTALTGSIWLNAVYPWPKLLAGGLSLGCAAAVLYRRPWAAGLLAGLALLAHGTALFALVGLIPWIVSRLGKRGILLVIVAAATYAPWPAYTRVVDPPGDRLIKWHLAGTDITAPDHRSAIQAVVSSYRQAGPKVIENKVENLRVSLGDPSVSGVGAGPAVWQPAWRSSVLGRMRIAQSTRLIFTPGLLLIALWWWRRVPRTLLWMVGSWWGAFVLLEWGGNGASAAWVPSAPMALILGLVAACALGSPRWLLPLQLAFFVVVWLLASPAFV